MKKDDLSKYEALEKEHMGDWILQTGIYHPDVMAQIKDKLGVDVKVVKDRYNEVDVHFPAHLSDLGVLQDCVGVYKTNLGHQALHELARQNDLLKKQRDEVVSSSSLLEAKNKELVEELEALKSQLKPVTAKAITYPESFTKLETDLSSSANEQISGLVQDVLSEGQLNKCEGWVTIVGSGSNLVVRFDPKDERMSAQVYTGKFAQVVDI